MNRTRALLAVAALIVLALTAGGYSWWSRKAGTLQVVEYAVGDGRETPTALAVAPDGAVWFTLDSEDELGVVRDGKVARVKRGTASVEPIGIDVDASGNVWLTDPTGIAVVRIDAQSQITSVPLGTPIARLGRLDVANDGSVWFAEATAYSFTRLKDGALKRHTFDSARGGPYGVAVAADGSVWGTLQAGNKLVRIAPDGTLKEFDIPTRSSAPTDLAVDASGAVWFIEFRANKVGRFAREQFTEYAVPEGAAGLSGLAIAGDGSVWFGALRGGALGRLRDGKLTVHKLPREAARPYSLVADRNGDIWYADLAGYVGRVKGD
jgi:virginiamycin B lyase